MNHSWKLNWDYGALSVYELGGMLGGVRLRAEEARWVEPFYEAPWIGDGQAYEPNLLEHLRSEFPCVPFGVPYPMDSLPPAWQASVATSQSPGDYPLGEIDDVLHGPGSIARWKLTHQSRHTVTVVADYPQSSPVRRLTRVVRCDPFSPAIDFSLTIESRAVSRRPVGIHPNLRLPATPGAFRILLGSYQFGFVHPAGPEKDVSRGAVGEFFQDIRRVPINDRTCTPFDRLPFEYATEEIVQLCGMDGTITLINDEERTAYRLTWDSSILPSLLIWVSNRGRSAAPWNGRNVCVGIEPLVGAFDLGSAAGIASNPINNRGVATALKLDPARPTTIDYRFELVPYPDGS